MCVDCDMNCSELHSSVDKFVQPEGGCNTLHECAQMLDNKLNVRRRIFTYTLTCGCAPSAFPFLSVSLLCRRALTTLRVALEQAIHLCSRRGECRLPCQSSCRIEMGSNRLTWYFLLFELQHTIRDYLILILLDFLNMNFVKTKRDSLLPQCAKKRFN